MNSKIIAATFALFISATSFASAATFAVETTRDASAQSLQLMPAGSSDDMTSTGSAGMSQESSSSFVTTVRDASHQ